MSTRLLTVHVTLSSKGRIVIPKLLRDAMGLYEGTEVILTLQTDESLHLTPLKQPLERLFGIVPFRGRKPVDVDETIRTTLLKKHLRSGRKTTF